MLIVRGVPPCDPHGGTMNRVGRTLRAMQLADAYDRGGAAEALLVLARFFKEDELPGRPLRDEGSDGGERVVGASPPDRVDEGPLPLGEDKSRGA